MDKISVIVPVYQKECFLRQCVDSVLAQDYENFEVILVDDGSPDGCPAICDAYAREHACVRVVHKENGGSSSARNVGIDCAVGRYICFIDADDVYAPTFLSTLKKTLENDPDAVMAGCDFVRFVRSMPAYQSKPEKTDVYGREATLSALFTGQLGNISACTKMFPRERIGELRFAEGRTYGEDRYFLFEYLMENHGSTILLHQQLYGYRVSAGSITTARYNAHITDMIYYTDQMCRRVQTETPAFLEQAQFCDLVAHLMVLKFIVRGRGYRRDRALFETVKKQLLERYGDRQALFSRRYHPEVQVLKRSALLYRLCVALYDVWGKLVNRKTD